MGGIGAEAGGACGGWERAGAGRVGSGDMARPQASWWVGGEVKLLKL